MNELEVQIEVACEKAEAWLRQLPAWGNHPRSPDGGVSANLGPTLLAEEDCCLHFARHLHQAGVPWEDMHFELPASQVFFAPGRRGGSGWQVDLAVVERERLLRTELPDASGQFRFDAFFEFALAGNYWHFGSRYGEPAKLRKKVAADVEKVARYANNNVCGLGYVVVFEECDHEFPPDFASAAESRDPRVRVRVLKAY